MNSIYKSPFTYLLFALVGVVFSINETNAQIGYSAKVWQDTLARESTFKIIALAQKHTLLTYTVKPKENRFTATLLYYLNEERTIDKIYISAFNAPENAFNVFIEQLHDYKLLGIRKYKDKQLYEFRGTLADTPQGFAYHEGGIMVFSTSAPKEKLEGDYTFEEVK